MWLWTFAKARQPLVSGQEPPSVQKALSNCSLLAGFAHGFCVLSESARVAYKVSDFYDPGGEISLAWNDPDVGSMAH